MHRKRNVDLNASAFVITWIEAHTVEGNTFLAETSVCAWSVCVTIHETRTRQ